MPAIHLTNGPIKELRVSLRALEMAIEAEYKIFGFSDFLAEFEMCRRELKSSLRKLKLRADLHEKEKEMNEKRKAERGTEVKRVQK